MMSMLNAANCKMQMKIDVTLDKKNTCISKISGGHLTLRAWFQSGGVLGFYFFDGT